MIQLLYVAPTSRGQGTGLSEVNAADYLDFVSAQGFWNKAVRDALLVDHVNVAFLDGVYIRGPLDLDAFSHPSHQLILQGQSATVLRLPPPPSDPESPDKGSWRHSLSIRGSQNIIIRNISFTGDAATRVILVLRGGCQNILVEHCRWFDLPNVELGATQARDPDTCRITYRYCSFERVGRDGHLHMMYHADGCHHIDIADCGFTDCSGQYVRFRNNVEFATVSNCYFRSTGAYPIEAPVSKEFVHIYVNNDGHGEDEYFGTHYVVTGNTFDYQHHPGSGERRAIAFEHAGYDPPGRHHLMTAEQGKVLEHGTAGDRKSLLKENCGIDGDKLMIYGNRCVGVEQSVVFKSRPLSDEESKGWQGAVPIEDITNADSINTPPRWLEPFVGIMMR